MGSARLRGSSRDLPGLIGSIPGAGEKERDGTRARGRRRRGGGRRAEESRKETRNKMPGKTSERERHSGVMFEGGWRARGSSNVTGGERGGGGGGCERLAIRSIESTARNCFRRRKKDAATRRKFFSRRKIRGGGGDGRKYWIKGELCGIASARAA